MRKRIVLIMVFLLLGAIVNVAVAWGCAAYAKRRSFNRSDYGRVAIAQQENGRLLEWWEVDAWKYSTWELYESTHGRNEPSPTQDGMSVAYCDVPKRPRDVLPGWARALETPRPLFADHTKNTDCVTYLGSGWPCISVWCQLAWWHQLARGLPDREISRLLPGQEREIRWALAFPTPEGRGLDVLPLHPLWPGFAINMIFYAAILWLLFFVPGKMWRTVRRRRRVTVAR